MTYEEAIRFWFGRVNYEQRSPKPTDLRLDRMRALLESLGNPHERLRVVHVAGSKGKGSTSAMLASVFRQAGYRTGLFTSPHLCATEERIQVDGVPITHEELASLMAGIQKCAAADVTFFEIATALGFLHFVHRRVDWVVLEVGLGGRFDSTNLCRPVLAIITSISHDHTEQLGNTLASIAGEKAGIVKPDRPTLSGARAPRHGPSSRRFAAGKARRCANWTLTFAIGIRPAKSLLTALDCRALRSQRKAATGRRWSYTSLGNTRLPMPPWWWAPSRNCGIRECTLMTPRWPEVWQTWYGRPGWKSWAVGRSSCWTAPTMWRQCWL